MDFLAYRLTIMDLRKKSMFFYFVAFTACW